MEKKIFFMIQKKITQF